MVTNKKEKCGSVLPRIHVSPRFNTRNMFACHRHVSCIYTFVFLVLNIIKKIPFHHTFCVQFALCAHLFMHSGYCCCCFFCAFFFILFSLLTILVFLSNFKQDQTCNMRAKIRQNVLATIFDLKCIIRNCFHSKSETQHHASNSKRIRAMTKTATIPTKAQFLSAACSHMHASVRCILRARTHIEINFCESCTGIISFLFICVCVC